jgi:hypothetical protein
MNKDDDRRAARDEQQSEAEEALAAARKTAAGKGDVSGEEADPAEDATSQFGGDSGGQPTGS